MKEFSVPIQLLGTPFQKQVWQTLLKIPYGTTKSYLQQAIMMDSPKAVRAVANANSLNKIAIIVPCHRVIGSNGTLTGYAGGLWRKEKLLQLEKNLAHQQN
ncbi:Methylated DNA-protein cysteine methyltransferase [Riemerella anatipestifer RA-GD]|uniref:methylated-DNA--[protein]-cysteine S-methyltransferase n=1 Tax=Riemerella anatipestifer TaxID=34085 RepID=UPI00020111AD